MSRCRRQRAALSSKRVDGREAAEASRGFTSLQNIQMMLGDLAEKAATCGLSIHPDKTNILSNMRENQRPKQTQHVNVKGMLIKVLGYDEVTKYLGRMVGFANPVTLDVDHRIGVGWKRFFAQKQILCSKDYPLHQRLKLFHATVTPTVLYGSCCWTMTCELEAKLRKTQRQMLRSIFQCPRRRSTTKEQSDSTSSTSGSVEVSDILGVEEVETWAEWIQRATHEIETYLQDHAIEDWVTTQRRRKHRWSGHVARRDDNRWSSVLLQWQPTRGQKHGEPGHGQRQSRPCSRWTDNFDEYYEGLGPGGWQLLATNREEWKSHDKGLAQKGRLSAQDFLQS